MKKVKITAIDEFIKLMRDPWRAFVYDYVSQESWITSYGDGGRYQIISEASFSDDIHNKLNEWIEKEVLFSAPIDTETSTPPTSTCYLVDVWRQGPYPKQKNEGKKLSVSLGLIE